MHRHYRYCYSFVGSEPEPHSPGKYETAIDTSWTNTEGILSGAPWTKIKHFILEKSSYEKVAVIHDLLRVLLHGL